MRRRLIVKLVSLMVLLVLSALGARSCSGSSSPSSPLAPVNVARNGVAGVCANQQAVAAAEGTPASGQAASPAELAPLGASDPSGMAALQQALGGSVHCPPASTP